MPQSENVQRGIHVAVENRTTLTTHPFSDPKTLSTFRAAHGTAVGTGLGCEAFRHFTVHHLPRHRFVFKKVTEHRPSGVIDGFGHVRFGQFGTGHVANDDQFTRFCQPVGRFMQKVLASVGDFGMEISRLSGATFALVFRDPLLLGAIPARRFDPAAIRTGRQRLQAQINTYVPLAGSYGFLWRVANEIDIPAAPRILGETAAFDRAGNFLTLPESEHVTGIADGIVHDLHPNPFEGNPAQRLFTAPTQPTLFLLLAAGGVFLTDRLHRLRMQAQFFARASGQFVQIKAAGPAFVPAQGMFLCFVAEIPDGINRTRHLLQSVSASRILNPIPKGFNHLFIMRFNPDSIHSIQRRTPFAALSIPSLKGEVFRAKS